MWRRIRQAQAAGISFFAGTVVHPTCNFTSQTYPRPPSCHHTRSHAGQRFDTKHHGAADALRLIASQVRGQSSRQRRAVPAALAARAQRSKFRRPKKIGRRRRARASRGTATRTRGRLGLRSHTPCGALSDAETGTRRTYRVGTSSRQRSRSEQRTAIVKVAQRNQDFAGMTFGARGALLSIVTLGFVPSIHCAKSDGVH